MPLVRRIEILEGDVNALRQLPEQVSAVAADLAVLRADVTRFRVDVRAEFAAVRAEFTAEFAAVRQEIRTGDEETRRMMRILHEGDLAHRSAWRETENAPARKR